MRVVFLLFLQNVVVVFVVVFGGVVRGGVGGSGSGSGGVTPLFFGMVVHRKVLVGNVNQHDVKAGEQQDPSYIRRSMLHVYLSPLLTTTAIPVRSR